MIQSFAKNAMKKPSSLFTSYFGSINGDNQIEIHMDYKTTLASQYIAQRITELTVVPLEIGFLYGGKVIKQKRSSQFQKQKTIITLEDVIIPSGQSITPSTFDNMQTRKTEHRFLEKGLQLTGIGHSHAKYPLFHSTTDIDSFSEKTIASGIPIKPIKAQDDQRIQSFKPPQTKEAIIVRTPDREAKKNHYVFPSLVFNARQDALDARLFIYKTKTKEREKHTNQELVIQFYNTKQILSEEKKDELDQTIIQTLKDNNYPILHENIKRKEKKKNYWKDLFSIHISDYTAQPYATLGLKRKKEKKKQLLLTATQHLLNNNNGDSCL